MTKILWLATGAVLCASTSNARSLQPEETFKVAAIQFAAGDRQRFEARCATDHDNCGVESLVRKADQQGAKLVVLPEYALVQRRIEATPKVGDVPLAAQAAPVVSRFAALANELGVFLVIHLTTKHQKKFYSTQVAFNPEGHVVGVHHKFELYASERDFHTPGADVMAFDTPFGRIGMLICADLYGNPRLHDKLTKELGVHTILLSAMWTVPRATRWQSAFARDWGVYVVAANGTVGMGKGGGVFDRLGKAIAIDEKGVPSVTVASIPVQR